MSQYLIQQAEALIQQEKFYPARKMLLQELKEHPTNTDLWRPLANTYLNQGFTREAFEIYTCLKLIYPKDTTYTTILKKIEPFLADAKRQTAFFEQTLTLKQTTITGAVIFKDEINTIKDWYEALAGKVDQLIAVDTGSTDGTREYLSTKEDVLIIDFPWNDSFSDARNAANSYITSEWVLWVDSDEYFEEPLETINSIRLIANYYETEELDVIIQITIRNLIENNLMDNHESPRMYRANRYHFTGRIHEQITQLNPDNISMHSRIYSGISFIHSGYQTETMQSKNKLERNLTLLKLDAIDQPMSPFIFLLLGRESRLAGLYQDSLNYLKTAEINAIKDENFGRTLDIYSNLIQTQIQLDLFDDAEESCLRALEIDPNFPNALYYLNGVRVNKALLLLDTASTDILKFNDAVFEYRGNVESDFTIINGGNDILKAQILKSKGFLAEAKAVLDSIPVELLTPQAYNLLAFIDSQKTKLN